MDRLRIQDLNLQNKIVLIRVDFNVPLSDTAEITDLSRIKATLPTLQWAKERCKALILMSHLGRPKGKPTPAFSLAPCAKALEKLLGTRVQMANDCVGEQVQRQAKTLQKGDILLLENLRFHAAEEKPSLDPHFAQELSEFADVYVNDAFAVSHRNHSSICPITQFFPNKAAAGLLMQKEIEALYPLTQHPPQPFYAIIGGAKVSTKIGVLQSLARKTQGFFIGGAMAFTFCKAQGMQIGDSLYEEEFLDTAKQFIALCQKEKIPLWLPIDFVVADQISQDAQTQIVSAEKGIPHGWQGVDIGPQTRTQWSNQLKKAKTVFWNGPVGVFEVPSFAEGTKAIATTLASLSQATTIVGGGDSLAAIHQSGLEDRFSHLSTGGGASLEFLEKAELCGINALSTIGLFRN